jgi:hypothetical protein
MTSRPHPRAPRILPLGARISPWPGVLASSPRNPRGSGSEFRGNPGAGPPSGALPRIPRDPRNPIPREPGMESRVGASSHAPLSGGYGGGAPV